MPTRELSIVIASSMGVSFIVGYIFYWNLIAALILSIAGFFYLRIYRKAKALKKKHKLKMQFKQALYSLSSSLAAGRSVENSFKEIVVDLKLLYPDANSTMTKEMEGINRKVENGETIERAIVEFSSRAGIDDITNFAEVFLVCKRTGGDLIEVIRRTSHMIGEKLEIEQDISVMIAQKKFESRALLIIPFVIIAFLSISSPDYMSPLYHGKGHVFMTIALVVLLLSTWITKRIMTMKV